MNIRKISIREVEYIAFSLAKELLAYNEPIPEFGTRFPGVLESCLATPFLTFGRTTFYKKLSGKAAILFYLMIKNHPFENGNKRIAVMTLFTFLLKNGKWLGVSNNALYRTAVFVAKSDPKKKDSVLTAIRDFFGTTIISSNEAFKDV